MRFVFLIPFLFYFSSSFSQSPKSATDTTKKVSIHSPLKAVIFSACIPGLGQAYNKKYWKIPLVYAAMGATVYIFDYNNKLYKKYQQAYINKTDTLESTIDVYPDRDETWVREQEVSYHKNRDLSAILTVLFYTLNVADAYVDAHLMTFDVSDNLSLNILPAMNYYSGKQKPSVGLTLSFKF